MTFQVQSDEVSFNFGICDNAHLSAKQFVVTSCFTIRSVIHIALIRTASCLRREDLPLDCCCFGGYLITI